MKLCKDCYEPSPAVCDFCKHYAFNGNELGEYTGDGFCNLHRQQRDPADGCREFHCSQAEDTDR